MQTKCSPGWEVFNPIILPADGWIVILEVSSLLSMVGRQGNHSTRWTMLTRKPCCWSHLLFPLIPLWLLLFDPTDYIVEWSGSENGMLTPTGWLSRSTWFVVTSGEYFYTHKYSRSIFHTLCPFCEVHLPPSSLGVLVIHLLLFFLRPLLPSQLLAINQCASIL